MITPLKTLDPHTLPLQSINLIEASAGTGKSWTVTLLYLRLLLEKSLTVDQILVVTFTDAATKELREAIRERLLDALFIFETPDDNEDRQKRLADKPEYHALFARYAVDDESLIRAISALHRAKLSLDEAAIFTIHGFCQRALQDKAFDAALPFESELMDDDLTLMQNITDDFWRKRFFKAPKALLFKLKQQNITPDSLLTEIRPAVVKPYLTVCGPTSFDDHVENWESLEALFLKALSLWEAHSDEIIGLLTQTALDEAAYYAQFKKDREYLFGEMQKMLLSKTMPSRLDSKFDWLGCKEKTKVKFESIEHPFFSAWQAFLETWREVDTKADAFIAQTRLDLLHYLRKELPKEKRRLGVLSFDDLLLNLQQAMQLTPELAVDLRQQYPAALIDEFQDTDPIQYDIFNTLYPADTPHAVFFVGDPKQAIYSFRGGDIHTYLQAKAKTDEENQYTLKTNWRSHPALIQALNALYSDVDNPFRDKGITYIQVDAGKPSETALALPSLELSSESISEKALSFWRVEKDDEAESVGQLRQKIAEAVAGDITRLLNAAKTGHASLEGQPLEGGDIAVLVRSHTQGDLIKSALNARGVASVQSSRKSIYNTKEASDMQVLLAAIADPRHEMNVRKALVTDLMGYQADDLLVFEEDSEAWENKLLAMQEWHRLWQKQGFLPMIRHLMQTENVHQHLLSFVDGERRLTNVLHLAELIHQHSHQQGLSKEEVLRWLRLQQENTSTTDSELRLESDEKLVKIVTIHKSKGLEYPIVYCPFVGISGNVPIDKVFSFHQAGEACLEIGSSQAEEHKLIAKEEVLAEDSRLLYVALTRAKYRCIVVCMPEPIKNAPDKTALGWLLTNGMEVQKGTTKAVKKQNATFYEHYKAHLDSLSQCGSVSVQALPQFEEGLRYQAVASPEKLTARTFTADILPQAQVTSFSGLTSGAHNESPDYDANAPFSPTLPPLAENEFPRGNTAGSCLHEIYENLDFTLSLDEQALIFKDALHKWGFEEALVPVAQGLIRRSLDAELFTGFSLSQLTNTHRLNEMAFYLPLEQLKIEDLQQLLYQHLPEEWQVVRDAVSTLSFEQIEGYLKGFIDLIFEHEGQFYVVDYKSNTLLNYDSEHLLTTMAESHYYLQALLYSVALHRYLQKRLPDYDMQRQFGGVYYLFIRGMSAGESEREKSRKTRGGVFAYKPDLALMNALDGLFMESLL